MSFQLQNLPFLALEEVIKCMGPITILCIIKTFTKTKDYVVQITKRLKTNLNLLLNEQRARCTPYQDYDQEMEPSYYLKRYTYEYSIEKFITVIEYFTNVFSINTVSLNLETRCPIDPYLLWKYVKDQNLKIKTLVWKTEDFIDEGIKEVIEGSSDLEILEMHFKKEAPALSAVDLYPLIGCGNITLRNIDFTSENLNLFMDQWAEKSKAHDEVCIVGLEEFDEEIVLNGFNEDDEQGKEDPGDHCFKVTCFGKEIILRKG
uniref:FBA_2 domain-containing protein n=1 Tax=Caenorhabditis tropicalis TaxID=1561998 RepID=A0A1I7UTA8_9PELO